MRDRRGRKGKGMRERRRGGEGEIRGGRMNDFRREEQVYGGYPDGRDYKMFRY